MSNPVAHINILRLMVREGQYDPMEDGKPGSVMHNFGVSSIVYQWLLDQEEFFIDFQQEDQNAETISMGLLYSNKLGFSNCLKAVLTRENDGNVEGATMLAHHAAWSIPSHADNREYPKRIKVLWDAGVDFHALKLGSTPLAVVLVSALFRILGAKKKYNICGVVRKPVPKPSTRSTRRVIDYDILDPTLNIKCRPRISKALRRTWSDRSLPTRDAISGLSLLEVTQRYLDAWMEVLLEAGLDIADYGRREERLHPGGISVGSNAWAEARVIFEYGSHVNGCRIHVIEIWVFEPEDDDRKEEAESAEPLAMPCSWDSDNE